MRLEGKVALVTAAGQGIGHASALALAAEGAQVLATDVNPKLLASFEGVAGVTSAVLDVLDKAAVAKLIGDMPKLDVLFNCAGVVHGGTALEASDDDLMFAFALNVRAQLWTIQAAIPKLKAAGGGSIVNMASVCSSIKGLPNRCVYGTTKAAVIGLTKAVAADFITKGLRCNAICPGTVESPSLRDRIDAQAATSGLTQAQVEAAFIARQPMGRLGRVDEIAALAVYLASDESSFTTGTTQVIDGGWSN